MMEKRDSHQLEAADGDQELLNGIHYTGDKGPCFGTRHVMIIMVAVGTGMILMTSISFSVVIVAMTSSNTTSNKNIPTYDWNNKGVILSSFMWLGIPTPLIAGPLGKKFGNKWLIFGSVLINALFFMLIPAFAKMAGSVGVIVCRVIGGGASGIAGTLAVSVNGLWVPAEERAKAGMISVACGFIFGSISSIAAGQIVASSMGYPGFCYIAGSVCLVWCALWVFLAQQSPSTHPRITPEEKKYIETSLSSHKTKNIPIPWIKLLTSVHFWAPIVATIGTGWIDTLMSTVNLIFITKAWDIDIKKSTSTLSVAPIVGLAIGCCLAPLSDFIIKRKYIRVVNARKIFHCVGTVGTALCLLWMTIIPVGAPTGLIILNLCLNNIFVIGTSVGGARLNILDIAPVFAGVISGFASTISQCFSLIAPMTIDWIVKDESDFTQWRIAFYIAGAIVLVTTIFFALFASDKREWDLEDDETKEDKSEDL